MKIALIVISCFVFLVVPQFGWAGDCSPLQISFIPPLQLVPAEKDVCGLRLNLPLGGNDNIYGLDLGFFGDARESKGIQLNLIGNSTGNVLQLTDNYQQGIQLAGLLNLNFGNSDGIQIAGFANIAASVVQGMQIAGVKNMGGDVRGIQIAGLLNFAESVRGVQIGLINVTQKLSGLQIGLVNYIGESPVPILPIINLKF
jgi:hypothetical protein